MADTEVERNVTNRLRTAGSASDALEGANYQDVASMRTFLAGSSAHGAGYYSNTRLNGMTKNDMVYAVRQIQDAGTIK